MIIATQFRCAYIKKSLFWAYYFTIVLRLHDDQKFKNIEVILWINNVILLNEGGKWNGEYPVIICL